MSGSSVVVCPVHRECMTQVCPVHREKYVRFIGKTRSNHVRFIVMDKYIVCLNYRYNRLSTKNALRANYVPCIVVDRKADQTPWRTGAQVCPVHRYALGEVEEAPFRRGLGPDGGPSMSGPSVKRARRRAIGHPPRPISGRAGRLPRGQVCPVRRDQNVSWGKRDRGHDARKSAR